MKYAATILILSLPVWSGLVADCCGMGCGKDQKIQNTDPCHAQLETPACHGGKQNLLLDTPILSSQCACPHHAFAAELAVLPAKLNLETNFVFLPAPSVGHVFPDTFLPAHGHAVVYCAPPPRSGPGLRIALGRWMI